MENRPPATRGSRHNHDPSRVADSRLGPKGERLLGQAAPLAAFTAELRRCSDQGGRAAIEGPAETSCITRPNKRNFQSQLTDAELALRRDEEQA